VAQLVVRNIEKTVKDKLQRRAKRHGRSMEEEVRDILRDAVKKEGTKHPTRGLGTAIASHFKDVGLEEDIRPLRGFTIKPPSFDE
jgi:plasmid stability protein